MNFDDAQPVENPRVEAIRNATVCAAELQFERSSNYLVKHWLGSTAVSVIYGDSNCGKSFFALDIAVHVAAGLPWMGHNTRKGNVLYLAAEGEKRSYAPRIAALKAAVPILFEHGVGNNLLLTPIQVDLHGEVDVEAITSALPDITFSLIVIDTLAMSIGAGSENDSADMAQFIKNVMTLKTRYNCHVMIVHHAGKDRNKGARGHSSLRAAVDTEIEVIVDGMIRLATCKKQRDLENGKKVAFTLRVVDLGVDDENDPITSCVVEQTNAEFALASIARKVSPNERIAVQALDDAIASQGRKMADHENYPANRKVVSRDNWRNSFIKMRIDSGVQTASVKKDFDRQSAKLQENEVIHAYNDMVWFIHEEDRQDI